MTGRQGDFYLPTLKFWDDFDLESKTMIGYWDDNPLVKTNNDNIKATVYKGKDLSVISVASWADNKETVSLTVDFDALGIDREKAKIYAPLIDNFQNENKNIDISALEINPKEGVILVIHNA